MQRDEVTSKSKIGQTRDRLPHKKGAKTLPRLIESGPGLKVEPVGNRPPIWARRKVLFLQLYAYATGSTIFLLYNPNIA